MLLGVTDYYHEETPIFRMLYNNVYSERRPHNDDKHVIECTENFSGYIIT
jgi:hypothetical protein